MYNVREINLYLDSRHHLNWNSKNGRPKAIRWYLGYWFISPWRYLHFYSKWTVLHTQRNYFNFISHCCKILIKRNPLSLFLFCSRDLFLILHFSGRFSFSPLQVKFCGPCWNVWYHQNKIFAEVTTTCSQENLNLFLSFQIIKKN